MASSWHSAYFEVYLLFLIVCLELGKCTSIGAEACKSTTVSSGCSMDKDGEFNWSIESNLCKQDAKYAEATNLYETSNVKMILCDVQDLDYEKIKKYAANAVAKGNVFPMQCDVEEDNIELGVGLVLTKGGYPQVAVQHFSKLLQAAKPCAALYYGRGMAYSKLGLTDSTIASHAVSDYTSALHAAKHEYTQMIYETRAEVFSAIGQHSHAYEDYTKALQIGSSHQLYFMRGVALVFMEKYGLAYNDIQESLRRQPHQTMAMHYLAMCLYHLRRIDEAIKTYEALLILKPDNADIMRSLAQAYREVGDFDASLKYYKKAIILQPTNSLLLRIKGDLLYYRGKMAEAEVAYRNCASLDPFNEICPYMKAACFSSMGHFYNAIKELTKATKQRGVQTLEGVYDYPSGMYLREWCRYIHSHLDIPIDQFDIENDLHSSFRESWANHKHFSLTNYTEQPGLQPHIKDVSVIPWENQSRRYKTILCFAYDLGKSIHEQGAFFGGQVMGSIRAFTATGLASLEISQLAPQFWKSPKSFRTKDGKKFTWRHMFDIAVKWIRFINVERDVLWMDRPSELPEPFVKSIGIIMNNATTLRYEKYHPRFYKVLLDYSVSRKSHPRYDENLDPVENFYRYYVIEEREIERKTHAKPMYLLAASALGSKKDHSSRPLEGYTLYLQMDKFRKLSMTLNLHLTQTRTDRYHVELEYIWQKIIDEFKKLTGKPNSSNSHDSILNLIISLTYYFVNLFPLSKSCSTVSYSTTVGLMLALGRQASGKIPKLKQFHLEALTIHDHEKFRNAIRSWLSFKRVSGTVSNLDIVAERFPTFRSMLQALQYDLPLLCKSP